MFKKILISENFFLLLHDKSHKQNCTNFVQIRPYACNSCKKLNLRISNFLYGKVFYLLAKY